MLFTFLLISSVFILQQNHTLCLCWEGLCVNFVISHSPCAKYLPMESYQVSVLTCSASAAWLPLQAYCEQAPFYWSKVATESLRSANPNLGLLIAFFPWYIPFSRWWWPCILWLHHTWDVIISTIQLSASGEPLGCDVKEENTAEKPMYVRFLGEFETFAFRIQQKWDCSKTVVFLLSSISGKKVLIMYLASFWLLVFEDVSTKNLFSRKQWSCWTALKGRDFIYSPAVSGYTYIRLQKIGALKLCSARTYQNPILALYF